MFSNIKNISSNSEFKRNDIKIENQQHTKEDSKDINKVTETQVKEIVNKLNDFTLLNKVLEFSYSKDVQGIIIHIREKESKDLIYQFPSEEMIDRLKYFNEEIKSILFDKKI